MDNTFFCVNEEGDRFDFELSQNDTQQLHFDKEEMEESEDVKLPDSKPNLENELTRTNNNQLESEAGEEGTKILSSNITQAALSLTQCGGLLSVGKGVHHFDRLRVEIKRDRNWRVNGRDYTIRHKLSRVFYRLSSTPRLQLDAIYNFIGDVDIPLGMVFTNSDQLVSGVNTPYYRSYLSEIDESKIPEIKALHSKAYKESLAKGEKLKTYLSTRIPWWYCELPNGRYTTDRLALCKMVSGQNDLRLHFKNYGFMEVNGAIYFMTKSMYDFIDKRYKLLHDGLEMYPIHVTFLKTPGRVTLETCEGVRELLRPEALREESDTPRTKLLLPINPIGDKEEGSDDDELAPCVSGNTVPPIGLDETTGSTNKRMLAISMNPKPKRTSTLIPFLPDGEHGKQFQRNNGGDMEPPVRARGKREAGAREPSEVINDTRRTYMDREFFSYSIILQARTWAIINEDDVRKSI